MNSYMKNGNQLVALLLSFVLSFSVIGCSGSKTENTEMENDISSADTTEEYEESNPIDIDSDQEESAALEMSVSYSTAEETVSYEDSSEQNEENSLSAEDNDEVDSDEITEEQENVNSSDEENEEARTAYEFEDYEDEEEMTSTMRNSINMLNYMTSLTQQVNAEKGNQLFLESAYNSFDNLFPNSVDTKTQAQITSLMDTIQNYRMISVKRARLQYIYEQNRAQALRQAIPNPIGLLSAVQSGSLLKAAASVLYMAVDSASSYQAATAQADLQFIKDGWELDDEESAELHNSTKNALTYMLDMVRDYDIPGDYALNKSAVENFVTWSSKPDKELERKISWFETNVRTYSEFGPYWLELAKDYYNNNNYEKCLEAVNHYEAISTRIFRKDIDYANVLPMAIISAKETMNSSDYVDLAAKYCKVIHDNTGDGDWTLRYFAAQIYIDLYSITKDSTYLNEAYKIARENVVVLVDEQKALNDSYLADLKKEKTKKDATKREKEEVRKYNKIIKEERKTALPPVSEALYLNSDLLFALADARNIDTSEKKKIESILHIGGDSIFLTQVLDDRFWFDKTSPSLNPDEIEISFDEDSLKIPASCVTDRSTISVTVTGSDGTNTFDEWIVDEVKRPEKSKDCSKFIVTFKNKDAEKYKYKAGETIKIKIIPMAEAPEENLDFTFKTVATKKMAVFNGIKFERVK